MRQKLRTILAMFLCCSLLTGCWDRTEINDLAIVLATGIDYVDEKVQLTAQIFVPRKATSGDSGSSSSSGVTIIRTAEGHDIAEALNRLQRKVARNMFWGHCEVIVISEQAGKQGLREYIDFLLRYPQFREHAYVFSSKDAAKDLLALLDPLERSSAESLREMANMKLGTRVTVLELAKSIAGPSRSAMLSRMLLTPAEKGQSELQSSPYVRGLSLYKDGFYVATINEPFTVGTLLITNELDNIIMPIQLEKEDGSLSIRPIQLVTMLKPEIKNGEWIMNIEIKGKGEVVLNTTNVNLTNPANMVILEQAWSKQLEELAKQALNLTQKELNIDIFKFSVEFRQHYPKIWKADEQNWSSIFQKLKVNIKVKTLIARNGKSTEPQGVAGQSVE